MLTVRLTCSAYTSTQRMTPMGTGKICACAAPSARRDPWIDRAGAVRSAAGAHLAPETAEAVDPPAIGDDSTTPSSMAMSC